MRRLLLLDVAALSAAQIDDRMPHLRALARKGAATPLVPPFGALTCPAHASMLTGVPPSVHGVVGNGWYDRAYAKVFNWGRSHRLLGAETLHAKVHARGGTTAHLIWRYGAHSGADAVVMERPTYWASGKKTFDYYTEPGALHDALMEALGPFPFPQFWGPMAGYASTRWILDLTRHVLTRERPTLTLSYAPFLDYDGQRYGPDDPRALAALTTLDRGLGDLFDQCEAEGVDVAVVSDYGFVKVRRPVLLNRHLRRAGFVAVHDAANGEVLEEGASRAFALCDNQVAHIYVNDAGALGAVRALLEGVDGVARVLDRDAQAAEGIAHPRSGDLVCVAERDAWFHYPYWLDEAKAPDFARCIAIFDKPGFDPCELFPAPKLHLARRVLQKKLSLAVPFDVVDDDPAKVGGARNADRADLEHGAVLVTSWPREAAASLPMEAVHDVVLERLGQG